MNAQEKEEIRSLPEKYRPMGAWSYFLYNILYCIPLIGLVCMIIFALSDNNIARRSHARSYFCFYIVIAVLFIIIVIAGGGLLAGILGSLS